MDWIILHQKFKASRELYADKVKIIQGTIEIERVIIMRTQRLRLILVNPLKNKETLRFCSNLEFFRKLIFKTGCDSVLFCYFQMRKFTVWNSLID